MSSDYISIGRAQMLFCGVTDFYGLFASVVTALRADAVCQDRRTAMAAGGQLGSGDEIVRSSLVSSYS